MKFGYVNGVISIENWHKFFENKKAYLRFFYVFIYKGIYLLNHLQEEEKCAIKRWNMNYY